MGIDLKGGNDCIIVNEMLVHTKDPNQTLMFMGWDHGKRIGCVLHNTMNMVSVDCAKGPQALKNLKDMCIG
jgi:hypothetical protein